MKTCLFEYERSLDRKKWRATESEFLYSGASHAKTCDGGTREGGAAPKYEIVAREHQKSYI